MCEYCMKVELLSSIASMPKAFLDFLGNAIRLRPHDFQGLFHTTLKLMQWLNPLINPYSSIVPSGDNINFAQVCMILIFVVIFLNFLWR